MKNQRLDNSIHIGLLVAVAFTALAHGAVEAWSAAIFQLLVSILMLLWAIKSFAEKSFELKVPPTALPLAAFLLLGLIQSVSTIDANGQLKSLSFDAEATGSAIKTLFFLVAAHVIAFNFFKSSERLRKLVIFLTVFGFVLAIFGLIQYFTWNGCLYWLRPATVTTRGVVGPFVNHNHFAGYMELIVPLPIALIVTGAVDKNRLLYGFAAVMMAVALAASLSRGGIVSSVCGLSFVVVAGFYYTRRKARSAQRFERDEAEFSGASNRSSRINFAAVALIFGAVLFGTFWLGSDPLVDRLTKNNVVGDDQRAESFESSRGWIWKNSFAMFEKNPVSGVGIGAFETAYPQYSRDNISLSQVVDRAHNDYLQALADAGLLGAAIVLWFLLTVLFVVNRSLRRAEPLRAGLAVGIGGAVFSMLVHSVFDFNLQIPSTSLLFLILVAVSVNLSDKPKKA